MVRVGGGVVLPRNRLMGLFRWLGSQFPAYIDYKEVCSIVKVIVLQGRTDFGILGVRKFSSRDFKYKKVVRLAVKNG